MMAGLRNGHLWKIALLRKRDGEGFIDSRRLGPKESFEVDI